MTIQIKKSDLPSVKIRQSIGIRLIQSLDIQGQSKDSGEDNSVVVGTLKKLASIGFGSLKGFLLGVAKRLLSGLAFSFTNLFSLLVGTSIFLFNFNWNISDEDIDAQVKSIWLSYASVIGGASGQALGFFTCGLVPATTMFAFNPAMGAFVLKKFGEEAIDEMTAQLVAVINATVRSSAATGFYLSYKGVRKILRNPGSPLRALIPGIDKWGKKGGAIISGAKFVEDRVESIKNPFLKNFTESLLEETWDGCVEAGFIVAGAADQFIAMQKAAQIAAQAQIVEIIPNRKAEKESLVLSGTKQELKPMITGILATHQLLQNRDVGEIVGYPVNEEIKAHASAITVHFTYGSKKEPPFRIKDNTTARYKISDVKRSKLDFQTLLQAADKNGYQWGRFLAVAKLSNGRRITAYGGTADAAKNRVMEFLPLQSADLLVINVTEETKTGNRAKNLNLNKNTELIYPQKCSIVVQLVTKLDNGKSSNDGLNRLTNTYSFPLWTQEKPPDFAERLRELFTQDN